MAFSPRRTPSAPLGTRGRTGLCLACVTLVAAGGCTKATDGPTEDPEPAAASVATQTLETPTPDARPAVEMIRWSLDLRAPGDMIAAAESLVAQLRPGTPLSLKPVVEAVAAQQGLTSAWMNTLDWGGRFALDLAYPQPGQDHARAEDLQLRGSLAVLDPAATLSTLPEAWSPTATGEREVVATRGEIELRFRALSERLLVGRSPGDLDAAASMAERPADHRMVLRAENLHPGDVDPSDLLELPAGLSAPISAAIARARGIEFSLDLAPGADLSIHLQADADLSNFGFDPLGPTYTGPIALADRLPPGATALALMSWGDPRLVHRELDRYAGQIPEPFDEWVAPILQGAHAVLDHVRESVALGMWIDERGRAAWVIAARIDDAPATQAALREVLAGANGVAERYAGLMGSEKNYRFKHEYKPEALGFSKAKVDLLEVTVPRAFEPEASRLTLVLGENKPKLELLALAEGDYGIVTFGPGARGVMAEWVRHLGTSRRASAETDGGLALARGVGGGCQLCVAIDPISAARTFLRFQAELEGEKASLPGVADLEALEHRGPLAISIRASDEEAAMGLGLGADLLFGSPPVLPIFVDAFGLLPPPPEPAAP